MAHGAILCVTKSIGFKSPFSPFAKGGRGILKWAASEGGGPVGVADTFSIGTIRTV